MNAIATKRPDVPWWRQYTEIMEMSPADGNGAEEAERRTPYDLPRAKSTTFTVTWPLYQELAANLRHFNTLQSQYRTMTSTWLLAALAGVGFIYANAGSLPVDADVAATVIAAAAAVGISLLWIIDVLVYHELLIASDEAARDLEEQHPWIPRVHTIGSQLHVGLSVRENTSLYYVGSLLLLAIIAAVSAGHFFWDENMPTIAVVAPASIFSIGCASGAAMLAAARRRLRKKDERRPPPFRR